MGVSEKGVIITYKKYHGLVGHIGSHATKAVASNNGVILNETEVANKPCENCAEAKASRKKIVKVSTHIKSKIVGERRFLDIASVKQPKDKNVKINKNRFWCMCVEESVGFKFSTFHATKNGMVQPMAEYLLKETMRTER